jgi:hypothetical protein
VGHGFKHKTIKVSEENTGKYLQELGFDRVLKNDIKSVSHKRKDKSDFVKIKNLCAMKDPVKRMKRQARV